MTCFWKSRWELMRRVIVLEMVQEISWIESWSGEDSRLTCRGTGNLPSEELIGESIKATEKRHPNLFAAQGITGMNEYLINDPVRLRNARIFSVGRNRSEIETSLGEKQIVFRGSELAWDKAHVGSGYSVISNLPSCNTHRFALANAISGKRVLPLTVKRSSLSSTPGNFRENSSLQSQLSLKFKVVYFRILFSEAPHTMQIGRSEKWGGLTPAFLFGVLWIVGLIRESLSVEMALGAV